MKPASGRRKTRRRPGKQIGKLPESVVIREGKTTIRQFKGRRFIRFGEVKGKTLAWVELYTGGGDGHDITVRFRDRTAFHLELTPMFTIKPAY